MTLPHNELSRLRLNTLTGLRFYAAFAVLLRHTVPELWPAPVLAQIAAVGPVGVGFFFVLSGFLLTWTWDSAVSTRIFYGRRIARIYPLHILTTLIAAWIFWASGTSDLAGTIRSMFLLHAWGGDAWGTGTNGPNWSLSVEAFFYLVAPFLIPIIERLNPKRCLWVVLGTVLAMGVWTAAYAGATVMGLSVNPLSTYTNPAYRLGEFAIGTAIASAMRGGWRLPVSLRAALALSGVGYAVLAALNWVVAQYGPSLGGAAGLPLGVLDLMYLPVVCVLIAAAAGADADHTRTPLSGAWHVRLGQWSFALYLVQMLVVGAVGGWSGAHRTASVEGLVTLVGTIVACVALSAGMYLWFEKPLEGALRKRLGSAKQRQASPLVRT